MGLETVVGNLLTCIIPLAGGSQVGLEAAAGPSLRPWLWGGAGAVGTPQSSLGGARPQALCVLVHCQLPSFLGLPARLCVRVSPVSLPGTCQCVCPLAPGGAVSGCSASLSEPPCASVSNCVSLPVCPVQLDSVEDGVVRTLCFFCPPRPVPAPGQRPRALWAALLGPAEAGVAFPSGLPLPRPVPPRALSAPQAC